jgi:carbon storage regulator
MRVPSFKINREMTMLVLSRKLGEKIVIGDNIVVTVVKIDRNQIRIGIEAPSEILVYREEIAPPRSAREERTGPVAFSRS